MTLTGLQTALLFPDEMLCQQRVKETGLNAMLLLLRRLVYPARYCDLKNMFGRPICEIGFIFNTALDHVYNNFHHLLEDMS